MTEITSLNGTALSPLCFGTMQFGGKADATDSRAMFDACRAAGGTFFDTAHVYTMARPRPCWGNLRRPNARV